MCRDIVPGQIIVIGTDGVWESQDSDGRMFGKKRLFEIIENNRTRTSGEILETVTGAIDQFCGAQERGDDVTLVIIKIL